MSTSVRTWKPVPYIFSINDFAWLSEGTANVKADL